MQVELGGCNMRHGAGLPVAHDGLRTDSDHSRRRLALVPALLLVALFALAWQAQAASATDSKVTVVKVNDGGNAADTFGFTPDLVDLGGGHITTPFTLAGGQSKDFVVLCNDKSTDANCGSHALSFTEQARAGYDR
jgi:hypothetical protein